MAREIVFTDDITGEPGAETVRFAWNEVWFEVDLIEANRLKLEELLTPYMNGGRPAKAEEPVKRTRAPRGTRAPDTERVDYTGPEHAGEPHRGRVSPEEAAYVRENLEAVNRRLKAEGMREIDAGDAKMAERYGI